MITIYVPRDSAARSVGADDVARAIAQWSVEEHIDIDLVRNGSRGALWLEPLVEVVTSEGRIGYGPVSVEDLPSLIEAGFHAGGEHPLRVGVVDELPWLASQQRVTFARMGMSDPLDLEAYRTTGGLHGLARALELGPDETAAEVLASGLRGRGGAGFPAGIKWRTVLEVSSATKYVVVNADEGDSGTFADRMLMEGDPFTLLEGMAIAGLATGAAEGLIYVRSEYPDAIATLRTAIDIARVDGWLGPDVLGSGRAFDVRVVEGAGSYVCGEETAMLESLEGKRGMVRPKPPIPALEGLFGKPTLVHNVLTLAAVPGIMADGAAAYQALGMEPISRPTRSMSPWTTRRSPPPEASWATAASWPSTTPSTWRRRRASPWSSARSSRVASAPPAGSAPPVASRSSTASPRASIASATWSCSRTSAPP